MPGRKQPAAAPPKVELRGVDELVPYAKNARQHTPAQVAQLARSLVEFGWTNPVLVQASGEIVAGHGRVLAAKELWDADKEIAGIPKGMVPCIALGHLTKQQLRAYVIADNQLALNAGWDTELLRLELADLKLEGFDLELTGFTGLHLDAMLGGAVVDATAAWSGMPEYENADQWSKYRLHVHFATLDDLKKFAALLSQPITEQTRAIWYPAQPVSHQHGVNAVVSTEAERPAPAAAAHAAPKRKAKNKPRKGAQTRSVSRPHDSQSNGRGRPNRAHPRAAAPAAPASARPEPELPLIAEAV